MTLNTASQKAKLVRLLHVAKTQLMMSDVEYRAQLATVSNGKTSSKALSVPELEEALRGMKARGFVVTINCKQSKPDLPIYDDNGQAKMIRGLWLELHQIGAVRDPSERALANFVKRMTGVAHPRFLSTDHASVVIEQLKKWLQRVGDKNGR